MEIKLYNFKGDKREVNKTLEDEYVLTGHLRDSANILEPTILVQTNPTMYNYCYIEKFSRYYYIVETVQYRNSLYQMHLINDPLMSWKDGILALSGIVSQLNTSDYVNGSENNDVRHTFERINGTESLKLGSILVTLVGTHSAPESEAT